MDTSRSVTINNTWTVSDVHFVGIAKSTSGELTNLLQFQAELRSTESTCFVDVEVDARALDRLLKRLAKGTSVHGHSDKVPQVRTIAKVIQELLTIDLSFEGGDRWDPVHSPVWRLEDNGSERHLPEQFLTFVGNIFRST